MEGQNKRDIEFEYYGGPDAPTVDRRRTQFQVPSNPVPRPFKCQECPRSFDRPSSLVQHMHSHTGEKPHVCTFCNVKRFATTSNLYRHMRGCPQNPNPQKGKAAGSRSQSGSEAPPTFGENVAEPSNTHHSQSPYIASDVPYYGSLGSQIDDEGASTRIQSLVPGSAPRGLDIPPARNAIISGPGDHGSLETDLPPPGVNWGNIPSPLPRGHVDSSAVPLPYMGADSSDWPAHPSMPPQREQDRLVAQTLEERGFRRQPDTSMSQRAVAPLMQSPTAEMTTSARNTQSNRFVYPSTSEVARDALQGGSLPASVVLTGPLRQPRQLSTLSSDIRSREAGSSLAGLENDMAPAEPPFSVKSMAPTTSFPDELQPSYHNAEDVPGPSSS